MKAKQPTPWRRTSPAERDARLSREAASVETGRAEIARGEGILLHELEAWFEKLDVDENAPLPMKNGSGR